MTRAAAEGAIEKKKKEELTCPIPDVPVTLFFPLVSLAARTLAVSGPLSLLYFFSHVLAGIANAANDSRLKPQ